MGTEFAGDTSATNESEKPLVEPIRLPTPEEIRGQDIWNNCAVRSVVSGVMGKYSQYICFIIWNYYVFDLG